MYNYVVFDIETPNRANDRISAIGITMIKDRKIADEYYSLVAHNAVFDMSVLKRCLNGYGIAWKKSANTYAPYRLAGGCSPI